MKSKRKEDDKDQGKLPLKKPDPIRRELKFWEPDDEDEDFEDLAANTVKFHQEKSEAEKGLKQCREIIIEAIPEGLSYKYRKVDPETKSGVTYAITHGTRERLDTKNEVAMKEVQDRLEKLGMLDRCTEQKLVWDFEKLKEISRIDNKLKDMIKKVTAQDDVLVIGPLPVKGDKTKGKDKGKKRK